MGLDTSKDKKLKGSKDGGMTEHSSLRLFELHEVLSTPYKGELYVESFELSFNSEALKSYLDATLVKNSKTIEKIAISPLKDGCFWLTLFTKKARSKAKYHTDKVYPLGITSF